MAEQIRSLPTNEQENELLKATFKNNEYLLKVIRSLFFGFEVSKEDKDLVQKVVGSNPVLVEAIRKKMYPILNNEVPIGQVADFWMGTEKQIFGNHRDGIFQSVASKNQCLKMLKQSFALLTNPDGVQVNLSYDPDLILNDELHIGLLARNLYIQTVETGLHFVNLAANQTVETPEQLAEKRKQDSAK